MDEMKAHNTTKFSCLDEISHTVCDLERKVNSVKIQFFLIVNLHRVANGTAYQI